MDEDIVIPLVFIGVLIFLSFFGVIYLLSPKPIDNKMLFDYCKENGFYQWEQRKIECKEAQ